MFFESLGQYDSEISFDEKVRKYFSWGRLNNFLYSLNVVLNADSVKPGTFAIVRYVFFFTVIYQLVGYDLGYDSVNKIGKVMN